MLKRELIRNFYDFFGIMCPATLTTVSNTVPTTSVIIFILFSPINFPSIKNQKTTFYDYNSRGLVSYHDFSKNLTYPYTKLNSRGNLMKNSTCIGVLWYHYDKMDRYYTNFNKNYRILSLVIDSTDFEKNYVEIFEKFYHPRLQIISLTIRGKFL